MTAQRTRILVTGASGFVGGSFMRRFASSDDVELFGVARRPGAFARYAQVDLTRPFELPFEADVVIHAAARASPWGSRREFHLQNVVATRNVVDWCARHGHPRLLYISSSSVFYRDAHQLDMTEDSPIGPAFVNEYAATKFAGEQVVGDYRGQHVVLRPRAVFGPGDTVLFPRIVEAAKRGKLPLFVGQDRPVVGDLIYIDVLCDYLLAAATSSTASGSYNLTNAEPVALQPLLLDVLERLGIARPTRRVRVSTAMRVAGLTEAAYRLLRLRSEPPLTRFGVGVFAYSKTFDVARALAAFGPPAISIAEGVDRFVAWQRARA